MAAAAAQIVIDRVNHLYRPPRGREVLALAQVSLEVAKLEFVALLGPSASFDGIRVNDTGVAFQGAAPIAAPAYTAGTHSTRRSGDNTLTLAQAWDFLLTLADDLGASGGGYGLLS